MPHLVGVHFAAGDKAHRLVVAHWHHTAGLLPPLQLLCPVACSKQPRDSQLLSTGPKVQPHLCVEYSIALHYTQSIDVKTGLALSTSAPLKWG